MSFSIIIQVVTTCPAVLCVYTDIHKIVHMPIYIYVYKNYIVILTIVTI